MNRMIVREDTYVSMNRMIAREDTYVSMNTWRLECST
jgi:hypothetical protein